MYPELFKIAVPEFLQFLLPAYLTVHTYGFCISLGIIAAYLYTAYQAKKQLNVPREVITNLLVVLVIAAVIGGKFFFFLERPGFYFNNFDVFLKTFSSGFVFYGSLLFAIPAMIWFFRYQNLPVAQMIDIMAITAAIVQAFGRMGCFFAGCCHGLPTESLFGVTFSDPHCSADPLYTPLHPTQLYEVFMLVSIALILSFYKRYKKFQGELFIIYLVLYAVGRSIIEVFRGDEARGFVMNGLLSHSQFIALLVFLASVVIYFFMYKNEKKKKKSIINGQNNETSND